MATNDNKIALIASRTCKICRGSGWVQESHGEILDCECAFENAPDTPEAQEAIDAGRFTVSPAPEYIAAEAAFDRQMDRFDREMENLRVERNDDAWIDNALHSACEGDCCDPCE